MLIDQIQEDCFCLMCSYKYLRDEQSQATVSADARGCSTRTKQTNKQTKRHSVSSGLCGQSEQDSINERRGRTPAGTFPLKRQGRAQRRTQLIAPTSTVPALSWSLRNLTPVFFAFLQ